MEGEETVVEGRGARTPKRDFSKKRAPDPGGWIGFWVVDKPPGMTSLDVIREPKKEVGRVRMGHTGTLDPLATGVLPVCVGEATKLLNYLRLEPKTYRGRLQLGLETDSWDITGTVISKRPVPELSGEFLRTVFAEQEGRQCLRPPVFSAIKFKGRPLYSYAREGKPVQAPFREITIESFRLLKQEETFLDFELVCSRGTYVRSVVHRLGERLQCGACLCSLRRLRCGQFQIEQAFTLEQMKQGCERGEIYEMLIPPEKVLDHVHSWTATAEDEQKVMHGNTIRGDTLSAMGLKEERIGEKVCVMAREQLIAVAEIRRDTQGFFLQPVRVLIRKVRKNA